MSVGYLLKWRLFRFIFGGQDARVSTEERFIQRMYLGLLAERIWENPKLSLTQKLVVMVTFDDDDIQRLVLQEFDDEKAKVLRAVRNSMKNASTSHKDMISKKLVQWVRGS